jgi:hypothetical protein
MSSKSKILEYKRQIKLKNKTIENQLQLLDEYRKVIKIQERSLDILRNQLKSKS